MEAGNPAQNDATSIHLRQASWMQQIQSAAVHCSPAPPPATWFMQKSAPNLPQRMLNELSESPTPETKAGSR